MHLYVHAGQDTQRLCWRSLQTPGIAPLMKHVWFVLTWHVPELEDTVSIGMMWRPRHSHHLCMYSTRSQNLGAMTPSDVYTAPSAT